ncbi:right-handed beta helix region protein [Diplodia corticola]|uniref:Right-handed beta helix region protein n=1 Tax=Diplodia corticola TaxID=236234 RepID=A0A1J9RQD5_9PEZI|nr:right-handed beta helix region protein [Diplodia corticola]OJD30663.1 right-handed beta helix region protein [Diplodia corticola]
MPPLPVILPLLAATIPCILAVSVSTTSSPSAAFPCISTGADETAINERFSSNGAGHIVQLCQGAVVTVTDTVKLTANDQELSTEGYPTGGGRATIKLAAGASANTTVFAKFLDGIKLRNIIVDGNRAETGYTGGDANIDIGGHSNGQVVDHVASRNPRGWSCLAVGFGGQSSTDTDPPCLNATLTNNDIGPCGIEGTEYADGISFQCTDSTISDNSITGSTDGGIVIFGAPGTKVLRNTITSSATERGFGAINLVDQALYGGSYANVEVRDNTITGDKLFNVGISIGAHVWSFGATAGFENSGPVTVTGNAFAGNIPFAIAINGWKDGLTVTNNSVSALSSPSSSFASATSCSPTIQNAFAANQRLVYYAPGLSAPYALQPDFAPTTANATNFLCTSPGTTAPPPSTTTFAPNALAVHPPATLATLVSSTGRGVVTQYQGDNNLVVYDTTSSGDGSWTPLWASGVGTVADGTCGEEGEWCSLNFQGDGNLVDYVNGSAVWNTRTGSEDAGDVRFVLSAEGAPWVSVVAGGGEGEVLWEGGEGVFEG